MACRIVERTSINSRVRRGYRVEHTHLTCHFRTAIAFRAGAGNHEDYFHLSEKEKEEFSLVFRQIPTLESFVSALMRFGNCWNFCSTRLCYEDMFWGNLKRQKFNR